mmetsp:Transcript_817/g.2967  ORF Transcript_817/g.2967 Transcript_817/m.2967 type:complete len:947 (+) Transcript_817:83-2923(+)
MGAAGTKPEAAASDEETTPLFADRQPQSSGATDEDNDRFYLGVAKDALFDTPESGLTSEEVEKRLAKFGLNKLPEKETNMWVKLGLEFLQPMALVLWFAIGVEIVEASVEPAAADFIGDAIVLFVLQLLNVLVGFVEELKAGEAIKALKDSLRPEAHVIRDGTAQVVDATTIVPGERVCLGSGAAVPADCIVCEGKPIQVDQAALTGESIPITMKAGDVAKMGSTVMRGEVEAIACATGGETLFGRTATLVAGVDDVDNLEKVTRDVLLTIVVWSLVFTVAVMVYLLVIGVEMLDALSFCVVLLISSIPLAMRVVCMTTLALGCHTLADEKAIVSRLSSVEELAGMTILCSDKTGTLTLNKMMLQEEMPLYRAGIDRAKVLKAAALAAKWWEPPKDALDTLVINAQPSLEALTAEFEHTDYMPFDPVEKRTEATLRRKADGATFTITKGAPHVLLELCGGADPAVAEEVQKDVDACAARGVRTLAVAATRSALAVLSDGESESESGKPEEFVMLGLLTFLDPPRPDTAAVIRKANKLGVGVKMITGDHRVIAVEMCSQIGMGRNVLSAKELPTLTIADLESNQNLGRDYGEVCEGCDGFAQVFPEHKFLIVQALRQKGHLVGMTGDGVNDAPALKRADVGIAVEGATDAARGASDIVLTAEGLSVIVTAIVTARKVFQRMKNFVIYRVACTWQLLLFFFIASIFIDPSRWHPDWPEYFDLPVLALVIITILNDGTMVSVAYDNVYASTAPERWDLPILYGVSSVIGVTSLATTILMLFMCLNSGKPDSLFGLMGDGFQDLSFEQVRTVIYLKISLTNYWAIFNARSKRWMWEPFPSWVLLSAFLFSTIISSFLARYWFLGGGMAGISPGMIMFVWAFCIAGAFVQEFAKIATWQALVAANLTAPFTFVTDAMLEEGEPAEGASAPKEVVVEPMEVEPAPAPAPAAE